MNKIFLKILKTKKNIKKKNKKNEYIIWGLINFVNFKI